MGIFIRHRVYDVLCIGLHVHVGQTKKLVNRHVEKKSNSVCCFNTHKDIIHIQLLILFSPFGVHFSLSNTSTSKRSWSPSSSNRSLSLSIAEIDILAPNFAASRKKYFFHKYFTINFETLLFQHKLVSVT